ncbi:hypothetical protein DIPPA_16373 [Diplonema papillatum]|nr:hypothetical protein DIPPA_16373 [Diplonema papillatum]
MTVSPSESPRSDKVDHDPDLSSIGNGSLADNGSMHDTSPDDLKEGAQRMLASVEKRSLKLGSSFAKLITNLQDGAQHQMRVQAQAQLVYHDAVKDYTEALNHGVEDMHEVMQHVAFLDSQLEQMTTLRGDVTDVLEAVRELDRVVQHVERRARVVGHPSVPPKT